MSKGFITTRKQNPCPLCRDTKGKCRETEALHLCMAFTEAYDSVPGFRFLGQTKDGLWGKWIADDSLTWTEDQRQDWQRQREQRLALEQKQRAGSLDATERDRHYQTLLAELSLHPADRVDLHRRGLTDAQIETWGVKSVGQWQPLLREFPLDLPGISLSGRSLNTPGEGYLCPIRNVEGLLVGFQIRLRQGDTRYLWLTSASKKRTHGPTPHLPHGELPLAIHRPEEESRPRIALVEGVGAKPFILAQRLNVVTIGAAGGQFASSPQTLKHSLEVLSAEQSTRTIEFYPDAGAILNRNVLRQYRATWKLLQQWGYDIRVLWWGQETKASPDIDELEDFSQIQPLTVDEFEQIARPRLHWLTQIQRTLKRRLSPGKSAATLERVLADHPAPAFEGVQYAAGDRLQTWQQGIKQGYRFVLDLSPPGSGKSFDSGRVDPAAFEGIRQVIYVSDEHRNPTVETLSQNWVDLEARHGGLVLETTPGDSSRIKRAGKGETPNIPANCNRTQLIGALRAKQIQGADQAAIICGTCPLRESCSHAQGPGYGFLNQRRLALSSQKLRSHPDSLPTPQDYEFSNVLLLWDEPGQSFTVKREIQVRLADLEQTIAALITYPEVFQAVQGLLVTLLTYLNGETPIGKFGLNHQEVLERLPEVGEINLIALEQILHPDLSFLNSTSQHGVDLADLPPALRKQFSEKDSDLATQADQRLLKQWLPDLLRILQGTIRGTLHLNRGSLTIALPDPRHQHIVQAAKATIFLDATLSREDLALKLGCQPEEIFLCQQVVPEPTNLKLTQVIDLGRMGMQRGSHQQHRAAAIVDHYQTLDPTTKAIDFKKFAGGKTGAWWRDSRGRNDFEQDTTLILIGTPCRNLADLLAEYAILTGHTDPEDSAGFKAFVDRTIKADFHQAIGRLRAHRRLDESLQVVILSDFDLEIANVQQVKASSITLEAADKFELFTLAVQQAAKQLQAEGKKITQSAVSGLTSYSQQYISRHWQLLLSLIGLSNSKSGKNPDQLGEGVMVSLGGYLEEGMGQAETLEEGLKRVGTVFFDWMEPDQWRSFWQLLSRRSQLQVLSALMMTLPNLDRLQPQVL